MESKTWPAQSIIVSAEELHKLNRTSIEIEGQGYLASFGVFHQLHCLNYWRRSIYGENYTIREDEHTSTDVPPMRKGHLDPDVQLASRLHEPLAGLPGRARVSKLDMLKAWARGRHVRTPEPGHKLCMNPVFDRKEYAENHVATAEEDTTEVVAGTRENAKVMALAGGDPY
ncbi:hypothetical protein DL771_012020 [Monosporascus sp. 5C6A]|nr:hypothetical protein DL771_012020 [Monosporascus sp. 5C6A]